MEFLLVPYASRIVKHSFTSSNILNQSETQEGESRDSSNPYMCYVTTS